MYGPRCCIVVPSFCNFTPYYPEPWKISCAFSCTFLFLVIFRVSWFYIFPGYVYISTQDMYPPCFHHTQLSPEAVFYECVDSSFCLSPMGMLSELLSTWLKDCRRHKIWLYNYRMCRILFNSYCKFASIYFYLPRYLLLMCCVNMLETCLVYPPPPPPKGWRKPWVPFVVYLVLVWCIGSTV